MQEIDDSFAMKSDARERLRRLRPHAARALEFDYDSWESEPRCGAGWTSMAQTMVAVAGVSVLCFCMVAIYQRQTHILETVASLAGKRSQNFEQDFEGQGKIGPASSESPQAQEPSPLEVWLSDAEQKSDQEFLAGLALNYNDAFLKASYNCSPELIEQLRSELRSMLVRSVAEGVKQ